MFRVGGLGVWEFGSLGSLGLGVRLGGCFRVGGLELEV